MNQERRRDACLNDAFLLQFARLILNNTGSDLQMPAVMPPSLSLASAGYEAPQCIATTVNDMPHSLCLSSTCC
jgi:hypothetical protein